MKTKIFASLFCFAFFMSYYVYLNQQQPQKASRALASVEQGFDFLSKTELGLLTPDEQRDYLNKISQVIVKSGVFEGVFRDRTKKKVSLGKPLLSPEFALGFSEAYAEYHCPMYGLHPFVRADESQCNILPKALKISEASESLFASEAVVAGSTRDSNQSLAKCPDGQKMCNPALIGFDFEGGKAKLRCLDDATNANCFKLRTSGEQMKKSLELIDEANPKYWDEFQKGMEEQCLKDGKFNESDEGCVYAQKQINYSTKTYRNKLSQKYQDLAEKLKEKATVDAADKKVCKQFTKTDSETALADHENFNVPGFKIVYKRGNCFRVPSNSIVSRSNGQFKVYLPDGIEAESPVGGDEQIVHTEEIGGMGTSPDRASDVRFYNFQCGPCNEAVNIEACLFNMRKDKDNRNFQQIADNNISQIGADDCRALISKLETLELPDVVFEKVKEQGTPFYRSGSID